MNELTVNTIHAFKSFIVAEDRFGEFNTEVVGKRVDSCSTLRNWLLNCAHSWFTLDLVAGLVDRDMILIGEGAVVKH